MPRTKKKHSGPRNSAGQFRPRVHAAHSSTEDSTAPECSVYSVWQSASNTEVAAWEEEAEPSSEASEEFGEPGSSADESDSEWLVLQQERKAKLAAQKLRKLRDESMKQAEQMLDGPVDRRGGARDKTGKKRGPYQVGGDSIRTLQRKRQKVLEDAKRDGRGPNHPVVLRQLEALRARPATKQVQQTLSSFFSQTSRGGQLEATAGLKHEETEVPQTITAAEVPEDEDSEDDDGLLTSETETEDTLLADDQSAGTQLESRGSPVPSSHADVVDLASKAIEAAEYTEDVLETAVLKTHEQLRNMADEGRRKARKAHDYRSEVLFASLVDFYRWLPRHGRLRASLRVSRIHQRGPAFARVLCTQARHFEATETLKPSHQGQKTRGESRLDDEAVSLGVQAWLRTLEPGKVSPKLLQTHLNTTLLPSLSHSKKTLSLRQARRWLWRLGYRRKRHTKGVYWDGHERKDVKKRRKAYLEELEQIEPYMATYEGADMSETPARPGPA
ncbi:hypothetical protein VTO73DRAFT_8466 [Trametes versicolor]